MDKIPGIIISAPNSGSGKTIITFIPLRALNDKGVKLQPFKTTELDSDRRLRHRHAVEEATPSGRARCEDDRADLFVRRVFRRRAALAGEDVRRRADGEQSFDAGAVLLEGREVQRRLHLVIR